MSDPSTTLFLHSLQTPRTWDQLRDAVPLPYRRLRELIERHLDDGTIIADDAGRFVVSQADRLHSEQTGIASTNGGADVR